MKLGFWAGWLGTVALLCTTSCHDGDSGASTGTTPGVVASGSFVLYPTTRILDGSDLATISSWSADQVTLTVPAGSATFGAMQAGDVLLGGASASTPKGILRKVTATTMTPMGLVLTTAPATLSDAIASGHATATGPLTKLGIASAPLGQGVTATPSDRPGSRHGAPLAGSGNYDLNYGFSKSLALDSHGDSVTLSGNVGVSAGFDVDLSFDTGGLTATFSIDGGEAASLGLSANAGFSVSDEVTIVPIEFLPVVFFIGPVPIVIVPELDVRVGAEASVETSLAMSGTETANLQLGLGVVHDVPSIIKNGSVTGTIDPPNLSIAVQAKASAGLKFGLAFYGLTGPSMEGDAFIHLGADATHASCWEVDCGLDVEVGWEAGALAAITNSFETGGTVLDKTIASGTCGAAPRTTFAETLGGTPVAPVRGLARAGDDGAYLVGTGSGAGMGSVFAHTFADGSLSWQRAFTDSRYAASMAATPEGFTLGGSASGDAWLGGFDSGGGSLWSRVFTSPTASISITAVTATSDAGYIATGTSLDHTTSIYSVWAAKFDARGNPLWSNLYGAGEPHAITATSDGGAVIVGEVSEMPNAKGFSLRVNAGGTSAWKNVDGDGRLYANAPLASGHGFVAAGANASGVAWAVVLGDDGSLSSSSLYASNTRGSMGSSSAGHDITAVVDTGSAYVFAGRDTSEPSLWVMKVGHDATVQWARELGSQASSDPIQMYLRGNGELVALADTTAFSANVAPWLLELPQDGNLSFAGSSGVTVFNETGSLGPIAGAAASARAVTVAALPLASSTDVVASSPVTLTRTLQTP